MARIRKINGSGTCSPQTHWRVGKYIRLSREDGNMVSESVVNQGKILDDEIPHFFEDEQYTVVDTYIDDGTSGTTDLERADFQRMVQDICTGRINCIIVKNLSRAFRNSANQGRFLEEFIPLYNTRFISLYEPRIDTFLNPEVVHSLEVGIVGFMNEQYAYKTSTDVRRTFRYKREKGEFIGAFAPYGYVKDPQNKNALLVDEEAAQVVRDLFTWFVRDGMSKAGISKRLNELGIPNPTAYKRAKGFHYANPNACRNDGLWNPTTVSRMLQDSLYIGAMRQGRQKVISYKVHKRAAVPEKEWVVVENAVPPIISREMFQLAQDLHRRDTRTPPGQRKLYLFSGLIRCADCGKSMTRRTSKGYVYYACRTYQEKSRQRCTKHSIRLDVLEQTVLAVIQTQIALLPELPEILETIRCTPVGTTGSMRFQTLLKQRKSEREKLAVLQDGLYLDWKHGEITQEQYHRMKKTFLEQIEQLDKTISNLEWECKKVDGENGAENPYLTAFLNDHNIQSLSRGLLVELVHAIYIHQDGEVEIVFQFSDPCRRLSEIPESNPPGSESPADSLPVSLC